MRIPSFLALLLVSSAWLVPDGLARVGSEAELAAVSQQQPEVAGAAVSRIGFVALGPVPPRRYKIGGEDVRDVVEEIKSEMRNDAAAEGGGDGGPDGRRLDASMARLPVLQGPKEGETPPPSVFFNTGKKKGEGREKKPVFQHLAVAFNNPASFVEVPAGKPLEFLLGSESKPESLLRSEALVAGASYLVFMYPTGKNAGAAWAAKPRCRVMRVDQEAFPDGHCRVVNGSGSDIKFMLGSEKLLLKPGKAETIALPAGQKLVRCMAASEWDQGFILNTAIRAGLGGRMCYTFYNASPQTNAGKRVGVMVMAVPDNQERVANP